MSRPEIESARAAFRLYLAIEVVRQKATTDQVRAVMTAESTRAIECVPREYVDGRLDAGMFGKIMHDPRASTVLYLAGYADGLLANLGCDQ